MRKLIFWNTGTEFSTSNRKKKKSITEMHTWMLMCQDSLCEVAVTTTWHVQCVQIFRKNSLFPLSFSLSFSPLLTVCLFLYTPPPCFSYLSWSDFWKAPTQFVYILSCSFCLLWSGLCSQHYQNGKATNDLDEKIQRKPLLLLSCLTSLPCLIGQAMTHF